MVITNIYFSWDFNYVFCFLLVFQPFFLFEFSMFLKFVWYDSMMALVFWLAWGILLAPTYHIVIFSFTSVLHLFFPRMYLMNAVDCGFVLVILSSYCKAQSIKSSSISHSLPYMISPTIWRTMACSLTVG